MTLFKKLNLLLESKVRSVNAGLADLSAEQIVGLIDSRAPEDEDFSLEDIFSEDEVEQLRDNPNLEDIADISDIIYAALMDLLGMAEGGDEESEEDDGGDEDESEDDTLDAMEATNSYDADLAKAEAFFKTYKRPADVSAKIQADPKFDINALIMRRVNALPDDILFGYSDILSEKELKAIANHPTFKSLTNHRLLVQNALETIKEDAASSLDSVIVSALFSESKTLEKGLAAEAAYRAGMATHSAGQFRLNELGERHAISLVKNAFDPRRRSPR